LMVWPHSVINMQGASAIGVSSQPQHKRQLQFRSGEQKPT
jgi:hypothetical protein